MTTEIQILGWSVVLGLVYVAVAASLVTAQRGLKWNAGNRDDEMKPVTGVAARATRASGNFLETFVFFAALVLALTVSNKSTAHTALGAQLYFWARVLYLPVYLIGIPYLRSLVWVVSLWGILQLLFGLL
jgi:uncharacterized MAPEG superfamily protein